MTRNCRGYFGNPGATSTTKTDDGWLMTGDIGSFDADGYLYVVDRKKELIKYNGYQGRVFPVPSPEASC